jgi:DNA-binding CsgD family transcriptional regulator
MGNPVIQKVLKMFSEYSSIAQKAKGDASTVEAKKNLDIRSYLNAFYSFEVFTYALVDISDLKIVKVGGMIQQMTGYDAVYFEGKGYHKFLKLHSLQDIYKSIKGSLKYFNYLYAQKKENRPSIKANRTLDLIKKDGSKIHVLVQGVPVLFNAKMEVIMFLLICTDITEFKPEKKFTQFILDSSDGDNIKKIVIHHEDHENEATDGPSTAERKILTHLVSGLSSKQIADRLCISEHTVRTHRKNMFKKFECNSASALVRQAILKGWV